MLRRRSAQFRERRVSVGERSVSVTGGQQRQEGISNNIHLRLHTRGAYETHPYLDLRDFAFSCYETSQGDISPVLGPKRSWSSMLLVTERSTTKEKLNIWVKAFAEHAGAVHWQSLLAESDERHRIFQIPSVFNFGKVALRGHHWTIARPAELVV
ncbi:hypothetical protein V496_09649 [Pseudogymnoascus sp. VKM F-4515 (FW-2607)]|nr:hypothetical protein V496_09649 [Pseudogymnoascus sp. VKM F-4515 (FW-2607)]